MKHGKANTTEVEPMPLELRIANCRGKKPVIRDIIKGNDILVYTEQKMNVLD